MCEKCSSAGCAFGSTGAAYLSGISAPILVVHGELDSVLILSDSKKIAILIPNAQFKLLPEVGYCANLQDPEIVWTLMSDFLFPAAVQKNF